MAVAFKGCGLVYIPTRNRFIRFVDGKYETTDADEIELLAKKYEHEIIEERAAIVAAVEHDDAHEADKPKRGRKPKAVENA